MSTDPTFWTLARASGLTAYLLLSASVLIGLAVRTRPLGKAVKPAIVVDLHRFLSLLGLGAIALHGLTLVADTASPLSWPDLLVPGLSQYRPFWTGLGVVAAGLTLLVVVSFSARRLTGARVWRRLHWATYGLFAAATAHGLMAGSDTGRGWVALLYAASLGAVGGAAAWRLLAPRTRSPSGRVRSGR
ncbi:MAG: ferric reductase-like transmembrane domain-containing protein [Thermoleophilia bacterium]|nr:ferric reductase-like transmembrane domain-containing protein [Thermoleophilia bacterium]